MPRVKFSLENKETIVRAHAGRDYNEMVSAINVVVRSGMVALIVRQKSGASTKKLDEEMAMCSFHS